MSLISRKRQSKARLARDRRTFHVSVEKDEAGPYLGRCKELPNAITQARTVRELKGRMSEVVGLIIEDGSA